MTAATGNATAAAQIVAFVNAGNNLVLAMRALHANPTMATFATAAQAVQAVYTTGQAPAVQAVLATGWTAVNGAYAGLRAYFGI